MGSEPAEVLQVCPVLPPPSPAPWIGGSRWHREFDQRLGLAARAPGPVTVVGETGVGKTLAGRHLHWRSAKAAGPCLVVDLRQIPVEAVESELFGYARTGLFNRAGYEAGLVERAGEGTCVVQGMETLPAEVQERLLPWLAEGQVRPMGVATIRPSAARIIVELRIPTFPTARTNPFITPLYDLLRQTVLEIPPLAARREDIVPIAEHYLHTYAEAWGHAPRRWSNDAKRLLRRAPWRENVRGVVAAVGSAVLNSHVELVEAHHLPTWLHGRAANLTTRGLDGVALEEIVERKLVQFFDRLGRYEVQDIYRTVMQKIERPLLKLVLARTNGNRVRAARVLGINRNTLRTRCKALGLK